MYPVSDAIRILLVDHQTLLRRSLSVLLNRRRRFDVVGEAATGSEALAQARSLQPAVTVVEPDVPEGGPNLISELCRETPTCGVLVLTSGSPEDGAGRVLQAGARGYLDKSCEPDDLARAIERVHAGELVVSPGATDALLKDLGGETSREPAPSGLTEREVDVLRLVVQGRTNPEIARELCITEHTAKGHLAKILSKLALDNRVQLATYGLQHGLPSGNVPVASNGTAG